MRTHSTSTVATVVLEPKVQVGAPSYASGSPNLDMHNNISTALLPVLTNRLKGYTRPLTCIAEVSDLILLYQIFKVLVADYF